MALTGIHQPIFPVPPIDRTAAEQLSSESCSHSLRVGQFLRSVVHGQPHGPHHVGVGHGRIGHHHVYILRFQFVPHRLRETDQSVLGPAVYTHVGERHASCRAGDECDRALPTDKFGPCLTCQLHGGGEVGGNRGCKSALNLFQRTTGEHTGTVYEDVDSAETVDDPETELLEDPLRLAMKNSLFNPTQCLARTEAVKETGGCDERVVHSQEYSMTLRLARRWPIMKVHAPIAFIPQEAIRLSNNEARQLQRVTRALALFLSDYPEVERELGRFACRRAAGRAWHYARRRTGAGFGSPWFWRYLASLVASGSGAAEFVGACCDAFELEAS